MASEADNERPQVSPVLFLSDTGAPIRFFLRPGATKSQLQPIIRAGGGVMCRTQEPHATLLADPEDVVGVLGVAAEQYISTQYIWDCVEKNQQLEVEDYRFTADRVQTKSEKRKRSVIGRVGYTPEEDAAILSFIRSHKAEVGGNRVWQQMEQHAVTGHSWQSMKDRYRRLLCHQLVTDNTVVGSNDKCPSPSPKKSCQQSTPDKAVWENNDQGPSPGGSRQEDSPKNKQTLFLEKSSPEFSPNQTPDHLNHVHPETSLGDLHLQHTGARKHKDKSQDSMSEVGSRETFSKENSIVHEERHGDADDQDIVQGRADDRESTEPTAADGHLLDLQEMEVDDGREPLPNRRRVGILEAAILEFKEDKPCSKTPDIYQSRRPHPDTNASACNCEKDLLMIVDQDALSSGSEEVSPESCTESSNTQCRSAVSDGSEGLADRETRPPNSSVHMVLFEQESLELDLPGHDLCLQGQLEWAKQQLLSLMRTSKQDLHSVTTALLKTSGDVAAASQYLLADDEGRKSLGPFWCGRDDDLLLSSKTNHHNLRLRFGEESVTKRIAFLDVE